MSSCPRKILVVPLLPGPQYLPCPFGAGWIDRRLSLTLAFFSNMDKGLLRHPNGLKRKWSEDCQRNSRLDRRTCVPWIYRGIYWCRTLADDQWQPTVARTRSVEEHITPGNCANSQDILLLMVTTTQFRADENDTLPGLVWKVWFCYIGRSRKKIQLPWLLQYDLLQRHIHT